MSSPFGSPPNNVTAKLEPYRLCVPEDELRRFTEPLRLSEIGPETWWNTQNDPQFGVSREWLIKAKQTWLHHFDWREHENLLNEFPNFKITVEDSEAGSVGIHFAALFSAKEDAVPVVFFHGFPASFMEFIPMMQLLVNNYSPETLPYHIIVPSLPDYGLSGGSTRNTEMSVVAAARIMNQLMVDLGFGKGYIAQGGDLGSMIARIMSENHAECKAFHGTINTFCRDVLTLTDWKSTFLC